MKTVLVTGATGFIGKSLITQLQSSNHIRVLSSRVNVENKNKEYFCDFNKLLIPEESFEGVDTVFHLAGVTHDSRQKTELAAEYRRINVEVTLKIAQFAVAKGVKRFVFISSVKAGGSPEVNSCTDEKNQGIPDGIYGQTKREAELGLLEINKSSEMQISIIRPALVYGPGLKGNLKLMLKGIGQGWFPPLPDTLNVRTMIHVDDLVRAIILAAEKEDAQGEVFIVTDGKSYSTRDIYNDICSAYGKKIPKWSVPKFIFLGFAKLGDMLGSFINFPFDTNRYQKLLGNDCYSSDKIRQKLGFKSNMTFKDALPSMINRTNKPAMINRTNKPV